MHILARSRSPWSAPSSRAGRTEVIWHCDRYVAVLISLVIELGADCQQPHEARADNDALESMRQCGEMLSCIRSSARTRSLHIGGG